MDKQRNMYLVPWADRAEWEDVRRKIVSDKIEDIIEAYEIMSVWKLRSDRLPAYVDCTAGILQVMIREYLSDDLSYTKNEDLRLSYSTAIIRFVNHVHNINEKRNISLYNTAKIQNIPDWIVTMRHDAAHGQDLPALETFHLAAQVSLDWLMENYWFQEELYVKNLESTIEVIEDDVRDELNLKLFPIYKSAIKIWEICCYSIQNCVEYVSDLSQNKLSHISNLVKHCEKKKHLKEDWVRIRNLLENLKCLPATYTLKRLKKDISQLIKCITCDNTAKNTFIHSILQSDFMLDFMQKDWRQLISLIQSLKCFEIFMKSLFQLAMVDNEVALDLLDSLAPSMRILKNQWPRYKEKVKMDDSMRTKAKKRYFSHCKGLRFPLKLQKPPVIKLDMIKDLIKNPTNRSKSVIVKYLSLVDPPLPLTLLKEANDLINIYCCTTVEEEKTKFDPAEKVYTLEDIRMECEAQREEVILEEKENINNVETGLWNKSIIDEASWSCCPLGLLPNQKTVKLTIAEDVRWKRETVEERRPSSSPGGAPAWEITKLRELLKTNGYCQN